MYIYWEYLGQCWTVDTRIDEYHNQCIENNTVADLQKDTDWYTRTTVYVCVCAAHTNTPTKASQMSGPIVAVVIALVVVIVAIYSQRFGR